jgi:tetratricopeptide (TPR) repeat protein
MRAITSLASLAVFFLLSGCASFQAGSEVNAGRRAFLIGNNEAALSYFQSAAQRDPDYVFYGTTLRQGVWSYVGRAEYATGRFPQARQALERALSENKEENIARLYLGLTLARAGDQQAGLKQIESGMRGIHDWIEYVTDAHRFSFGQFWDPRREIRSAIQGDLAMISGRDVDWRRLIADGEWLGKRVEEEIDLVRRDEATEWKRNNSESDGRP